MQSLKPLLLLVAGIAVLGALYLIVRPGGGSDSSPTTGTTASQVRMIRIVVRNGTIVGGLPHVVVHKGANVRLVVSADVSDEVHLHGYDRHEDVSPGHPVTIPFRATIAGRFEAELESRKFQILDLEVRP